VPELVREIAVWMKPKNLEKRPKVLWLQEGVGNSAAEEEARSLGLIVVSNRCILKDHARLMGR
jgi:predicted CoA-binding protein